MYSEWSAACCDGGWEETKDLKIEGDEREVKNIVK